MELQLSFTGRSGRPRGQHSLSAPPGSGASPCACVAVQHTVASQPVARTHVLGTPAQGNSEANATQEALSNKSKFEIASSVLPSQQPSGNRMVTDSELEQLISAHVAKPLL